jgi:hypothetical protein
MRRPINYDETLKVHILYCATGVSRPKIGQILALAKEMEMTNRIAATQLRRPRQRVVAEIVDGGCTVYRPAFWCRASEVIRPEPKGVPPSWP